MEFNFDVLVQGSNSIQVAATTGIGVLCGILMSATSKGFGVLFHSDRSWLVHDTFIGMGIVLVTHLIVTLDRPYQSAENSQGK
jgi:hypothetical protein